MERKPWEEENLQELVRERKLKKTKLEELYTLAGIWEQFIYLDYMNMRANINGKEPLDKYYDAFDQLQSERRVDHGKIRLLIKSCSTSLEQSYEALNKEHRKLRMKLLSYKKPQAGARDPGDESTPGASERAMIDGLDEQYTHVEQAMSDFKSAIAEAV